MHRSQVGEDDPIAEALSDTRPLGFEAFPHEDTSLMEHLRLNSWDSWERVTSGIFSSSQTNFCAIFFFFLHGLFSFPCLVVRGD